MNFEKQKYVLCQRLSSVGLINALTETNVLVAGGAVRSVFAKEPVRDYDLYFRSIEDFDEMNVWLHEHEGFEKILVTETAITYRGRGVTLQLIRMPEFFCEDPWEVLKQFDFTVCMGAYDFAEKKFILGIHFLEHIAARELHFNIEAQYPIASLFRVRKYISKGYHIPGVEIIKLGLAIHKLELKSYKDLRKQLQGIDTLFLKDLTDKFLEDEYAEKEYDFIGFLDMLRAHYEELLDRVMVGSEEEEK